jgi:hypothetical protein
MRYFLLFTFLTCFAFSPEAASAGPPDCTASSPQKCTDVRPNTAVTVQPAVPGQTYSPACQMVTSTNCPGAGILVPYGTGQEWSLFVANHPACVTLNACGGACVMTGPLSGLPPPACGSANGAASATAPTTNLCSVGGSGRATQSGSNWVWACDYLGSTQCEASCSAPVISAGCGSAAGVASATAPSANLCAPPLILYTPPSVTLNAGTNTWNWQCVNGQALQACSAPAPCTPVASGTMVGWFCTVPATANCTSSSGLGGPPGDPWLCW